MIWKLGFLFLSFFCLPLPVGAATYEVGPGKAYANIGDVPWEEMKAGDLVRIHWRPEPYREKWVIAVAATQQQPFTVRGEANAEGQLPVIDGRDATTRSQINFWNEERCVIKIGGANQPNVAEHSWVVLENLDVRSGRPPFQFSGRSGLSNYSRNAAAIFMEAGRSVTIRNCILRDSGNGLFISHASRSVLIEGCSIYDNGIEGSIYEHNAYTAAIGIVYQFNHLGPLRAGCLGNNLKDRSAGLVVRHNWIESGNRQLDLVDAEDSMELSADPSYRTTFVYGNILVEPDGAGNSQMIHYGGDSGAEDIYRKGTLYLYNNTLVSTRSGNTTLLRLSTQEESCDCRNNIVYTTAPGSFLGLLNEAGRLQLTHNWLKSGWVASHSGLTGTIVDGGGNLAGDHPGFQDEAAQDYRLLTQSGCVDAGGPLPAGVPPVIQQYVKHRLSNMRPVDAAMDIGAYEAAGGLRPQRGVSSAVWLLFKD